MVKKTNYTTRSVVDKWKTIDDYVRVIPNQDSIIKRDDTSFLTSCPLSHNHKHGDRNQSFIINEVDSNKYKDKKIVLVKINPKYFRPAEVNLLLGDPTDAIQKLGWKPQKSFDKLVESMVKLDLDEIQKAS